MIGSKKSPMEFIWSSDLLSTKMSTMKCNLENIEKWDWQLTTKALSRFLPLKSEHFTVCTKYTVIFTNNTGYCYLFRIFRSRNMI